MMGADQGEELLIARFTVARESRQRGDPLRLPDAAPAGPEAEFEVRTDLAFRHMRGLLNERSFDMESVAPEERLPLAKPVVWTFSNTGAGMLMPHPMHVHGVRFRVIERDRASPAPSDLAEGIVDAGFKDTVLVFPGERVRLLLTPTEPGLFLYHCHNLEHEDGGMMRNYLVS